MNLAVVRVLQCLEIARQSSATKLQILAGQPPRMRVGGQLSEPIQLELFHFSDTQAVVESLLDAEALKVLDKDGSVDVAIPEAWNINASMTVFFGNGCHNLIVHLT